MANAKWLEVGAPTLDRPFGLKLWPIFSNAFEMVKGYPAEPVRFVSGVTPMSTMTETDVALISYYIIVFGGRELMKGREPMKLNGIFKIHNFYLTVISAVLLVLFMEQLIPTVTRHGIFYSICSFEGGWTNQLVILYYVS